MLIFFGFLKTWSGLVAFWEKIYISNIYFIFILSMYFYILYFKWLWFNRFESKTQYISVVLIRWQIESMSTCLPSIHFAISDCRWWYLIIDATNCMLKSAEVISAAFASNWLDIPFFLFFCRGAANLGQYIGPLVFWSSHVIVIYRNYALIVTATSYWGLFICKFSWTRMFCDSGSW